MRVIARMNNPLSPPMLIFAHGSGRPPTFDEGRPRRETALLGPHSRLQSSTDRSRGSTVRKRYPFHSFLLVVRVLHAREPPFVRRQPASPPFGSGCGRMLENSHHSWSNGRLFFLQGRASGLFFYCSSLASRRRFVFFVGVALHG